MVDDTRDESFVQIPRWILLDSYVAADHKALSLYLYMHARARHTPGWINAKSGRGGSNSKPLYLDRGQVAMGRNEAEKIGLTENEYRSRMKKLDTFGLTKMSPSNEGTIVTITHYDVFPPTYSEKNHQPKEAVLTNENTTEGGLGELETTNLFRTQTTNEPPTNHQRTTTNNKGKKEKKNTGGAVATQPLTGSVSEKAESAAPKKFFPPSVEEVTKHCQERGNTVDPEKFLAYYESSGWKMSSGNAVKNWKASVTTWESNDKKRNPNESSYRSDLQPFPERNSI